MVNNSSNIIKPSDNIENKNDIPEHEYSKIEYIKRGLSYYKNIHHLNKIITLQLFFRSKLNIINNIREEVKKLSNVIQSISKNLNILNNYSIISNISYINYMNKLDDVFEILRYNIPRPINLINYGGINSYKFFIEISKIKLELIGMMKNCGISKISDAIYLIIGKSINEIFDNQFCKKNIETCPKIDFFNECFNPVSVEIYSSNSDIDIIDNLTTNKQQLKEPICVPLDVIYTLFEKIHGAKVYIPVQERLLIVKGFFKKDHLQYGTSTYQFLHEKQRNIEDILMNYPAIPDTFKQNYLQRMQLKELILLDQLDIVNRIENHYKLLQKYCQKSITNIIKDFLSASIVEKVLLLTLFLLDIDKNNTAFIAYILYDIYIYNQKGFNVITNDSDGISISSTSNDTTVTFQVTQNKNKLQINNNIYDYLHWKTQVQLKLIFQKMNVTQKNITNITDDKIPYEKRIQLIRGDQIIKSKALTKLKEINSSKGESNVKAQQYLDGLLKIPFGVYKKESVMRSLEMLIDRVKGVLISIKKYINTLPTDLKNQVNATTYINFNFENFENVLDKYIKKDKITSKELDDIVNKYINYFELHFEKDVRNIDVDSYMGIDMETHINSAENKIISNTVFRKSASKTESEILKSNNDFDFDKPNFEKIRKFERVRKSSGTSVQKSSNFPQYAKGTAISNSVSNYDFEILSRSKLNKMKKQEVLTIAKQYNNIDTDIDINLDTMLKKDIVNYVLKQQYTIQHRSSHNNHSTIDISEDIIYDVDISDENVEILYDNVRLKFLDLLRYFRDIHKDIKYYKRKCSEYLTYVDEALDNSVYGMKEPKKQIKHIIAQWINGSNDGYIFGFEGSPGTGKTTLAKQGIAKCIQDDEGNSRPFAFIALGGSSNGSTLEGHNYTYVGSTWGKIVDTLMTTKCMNPIIYIDELDKISRTEHGKEIVGILTHMTDMSQNELFNDKYFAGVPIDISKCLIIFSYNDVSKIDKILLDRIHRIRIKDMNKYEKVQVMKNYVYSQILDSIGFQMGDIILDDFELLHIIDTYTCEPGVRKLKEKVFELFREVNYQYLLENITKFPYKITTEFIEDKFTDKPKVHYNTIAKEPQIGIVNGLFATEDGLGGVLFVECYRTISDVRLKLNLTGQQGKTMRESMEVAKTVAWNLLTQEQQEKINTEQPFGLHIHCPEAATPKDGPSAGAAIVLTIYSQLLGKKINNTYALTGEIRFMNGMINKIGGLDLKVGGARRAGVKTVLCPRENEDDLEKILNNPYNPKDPDFEIKMVDTIRDVIELMIID